MTDHNGESMRERIARAVAETKCNGTSLRMMADRAAHAVDVKWDEDKFSQSVLTIAAAVLTAIEEPTEGMIDAAHDLDEGLIITPIHENLALLQKTGPSRIWQAMISAAKDGA